MRLVRLLFLRTGRATPWDLFRAIFWTLCVCAGAEIAVGLSPVLAAAGCVAVGVCVFAFLFAADFTGMRGR